MGQFNLETLSKLSNIIQIIVLVLLFLGVVLQTSKFLLDRKISILKEEQTKDRFSNIEDRPDFDQSMWSMITGIPSSMFKEYHEALDLYDKKDFGNTAKVIQSVIEDYEKLSPFNFKGYDEKQHWEKICEFYILSAKANTQLKQPNKAYEDAKKANDINKTHYTFYGLSITAYNLKRYKEALDNINEAIKIKPNDSLPDMAEYKEIKERCLRHLNIDSGVK